MKYIIYSVLLVLCFSACEKQEIKPYGQEHYIQFTSLYTDTVNFSFFFSVEDEVAIPLEVKLVGDMLSSDTPIRLQVNQEESTAPAALYELPETVLFSKGQTKDTISVHVKRSGIAAGDQNVYVLVLDIMNGEQLLVGEANYSRRAIKISNVVGKPAWWDSDVDKTLGTYTLKKFNKFKEVTQIGDLTGWTWNAKRIIALQFKNYLRQYEPDYTDEDGSIMWKNLPVLGS